MEQGQDPGPQSDQVATGTGSGSQGVEVTSVSGPKRVRWLPWLYCALVGGLWLAALASSTHETVQPMRASLALLRSNDFDRLLKSQAPFLDIKRTIQAHYLSYGVYIPLDDIVLNAQEKQPLRELLESACKPGRATVWVPLKFHVPLAGEKVFEWCLVKV